MCRRVQSEIEIDTTAVPHQWSKGDLRGAATADVTRNRRKLFFFKMHKQKKTKQKTLKKQKQSAGLQLN